jgi:hypothetical protein
VRSAPAADHPRRRGRRLGLIAVQIAGLLSIGNLHSDAVISTGHAALAGNASEGFVRLHTAPGPGQPGGDWTRAAEPSAEMPLSPPLGQVPALSGPEPAPIPAPPIPAPPIPAPPIPAPPIPAAPTPAAYPGAGQPPPGTGTAMASANTPPPGAGGTASLVTVTVTATVTAQGTTSATSPAGFHGWASGASGDRVVDGSFGAWRGSPVTATGTWDDNSAAAQSTLPTLTGPLANWAGDLDIAVGGTVLGSGESYAQAAAGAYQNRWAELAQTLQRLRGDKPGITYVRPFHEFNGNWYKEWQVTPDNVADYRAAFRRLAQTVTATCSRCKIVWSPNNGTSSGSASPIDAYPGDDVVDVIGIDSYNANGNTVVTDAQAWTTYATTTRNGIPVGVEMWRQFAQSHGKPLSLPEWGLNSGSGGGDNPAYIQGMHDWISEHAAQPGNPDVAGKVVYDVYFNIAMGGNTGFLIKDGPNANAARTYLSLTWGNSIPL